FVCRAYQFSRGRDDYYCARLVYFGAPNLHACGQSSFDCTGNISLFKSDMPFHNVTSPNAARAFSSKSLPLLAKITRRMDRFDNGLFILPSYLWCLQAVNIAVDDVEGVGNNPRVYAPRTVTVYLVPKCF